jgi:hypothetical protein
MWSVPPPNLQEHGTDNLEGNLTYLLDGTSILPKDGFFLFFKSNMVNRQPVCGSLSVKKSIGIHFC